MLQCRCFKQEQLALLRGLRSRDLPERALGSQAGAAFASLPGVEMGSTGAITPVWCGGPWLPHLLLAPVHSSVRATGLSQTEMKTAGRTWGKKSLCTLFMKCVCHTRSRNQNLSCSLMWEKRWYISLFSRELSYFSVYL